MKPIFSASFRFILLCFVLLGGAYTLTMTGVGQLLFHHQVNGSLVRNQIGQVTGSSLIGQDMQDLAYFQGRPMQVSQLAPVSQQHKDLVNKRRKKLSRVNPEGKKVPLDLVTASASGLDPHISLDAALFQMQRIANVRNLSISQIKQLITRQAQHDFMSDRQFVNLLQLNLELDKLS